MPRKSLLTLLSLPFTLAQSPHLAAERGPCSNSAYNAVTDYDDGITPHTNPMLKDHLPDYDVDLKMKAKHPGQFNRPFPCYFEGELEKGMYHPGPNIVLSSVSSYVSPGTPATGVPEVLLPTASATGIPETPVSSVSFSSVAAAQAIGAPSDEPLEDDASNDLNLQAVQQNSNLVGTGVTTANSFAIPYDSAVNEIENDVAGNPASPSGPDAFFLPRASPSSDTRGAKLDTLKMGGLDREAVAFREVGDMGSRPLIEANVRLGEQGRANAAAPGNFPAGTLENPEVYALTETVAVEQGATAGEFAGAGREIIADDGVRTLVVRQEPPTPVQSNVASLVSSPATTENLPVATTPATSVGQGMVMATVPPDVNAIVTGLPILLGDAVVEHRRPMNLFHIYPRLDLSVPFHPIDIEEEERIIATEILPPAYGLTRATDVPDGEVVWVPIENYEPHPEPTWPPPEYVPYIYQDIDTRPEWEYIDSDTGRIMHESTVEEATNEQVIVGEPVVISETKGAPVVVKEQEKSDISDLVDRLVDYSANTVRSAVSPPTVEEGPEYVPDLVDGINLEFKDVLRIVADGELTKAAGAVVPAGEGKVVETAPTLEV